MLLGLQATFMSCQKEEAANQSASIDAIALAADKQTVAPDLLPTAVLDYIAINHSPLTAEAAWYVRGAGYEVALESGELLYFSEDNTCLDRRGRRGRGCLQGDTLALDALPVAVADYLAANFPDQTVNTLVSKRGGEVLAVELSGGQVLLFDAAGTFLRECVQGNGPSNPDPHPHDTIHPTDSVPHVQRGCLYGDTLTIADLPTAATDYVAANFPDLTINTVVFRSVRAIWAVELSDGSVLLFTEAGAYIKNCGERTGNPGDGPGHGDGPGDGPGGGHGPGHGDGPGGGHGPGGGDGPGPGHGGQGGGRG